MKVGFVSDTHWGFAQGSVRDRDAFNQSFQAMKLALAQKVDVILMPGDLFDSEVPTPEAWHDAFEVLRLAQLESTADVSVTYEKNGVTASFSFQGVPVIALHGTHDFRTAEFKNAMDILQAAGFLLHAHGGKIIVKKGSETLNVFGMSGVPEKKALDVLRAYQPVAVKADSNIFMMHQSIKEFLPTSDEMAVSISTADLPRDFDLVVNGHLHWPALHELDNGLRLLLCGSTITTQMKKLESTKQKGIWVFDTLTKKLDFFSIPLQRSLYYHAIRCDHQTPATLLDNVRACIVSSLDSSAKSSLTPLIRVKVSGTLEKGFSPADVSFKELEKEFSTLAVLSLDKHLSADSFSKTLEQLRHAQEERQNLSEWGLKWLESNLSQTDFPPHLDIHLLFEYLEEGEMEKAAELLRQAVLVQP